MRRLAIVSIIIMLLTACGPSAQSPVGNPTPNPGSDLSGRFVEVPPNQPFRYAVVAAGLIQVTGGPGAALGNVGPSYSNLRVIGPAVGGRFVVTFDGYGLPDQNSNLIVKALAEGSNQSGGAYVVFFNGFNPAGIDLAIRDVKADRPPGNLDTVKVMVEISRYTRTN